MGDSSFTAEPKATAGPQAAICSCGADLFLRRRFVLEATICARYDETPRTKSAAICSCGGDLWAIPAVAYGSAVNEFAVDKFAVNVDGRSIGAGDL